VKELEAQIAREKIWQARETGDFTCAAYGYWKRPQNLAEIKTAMTGRYPHTNGKHNDRNSQEPRSYALAFNGQQRMNYFHLLGSTDR
jgi:hypothetical protein